MKVETFPRPVITAPVTVQTTLISHQALELSILITCQCWVQEERISISVFQNQTLCLMQWGKLRWNIGLKGLSLCESLLQL